MPMAPYRHVDYGSRIAAIRAVAVALSAPNAAIPSQSASQDNTHSWKWLAALYALNGLPNPYSIDYKSFTSALNLLVAKVP